ncbi:MAG: 4-(cytidine 5'-diphospho)-2-C-methyl-D-erythritol kinase [Planctomycetaceae bacterium]|nr:MAG: 4-(cytidine 5'-diphospho)-2-C-methyl-D-erythritol kinase [Planctomycetaceae bacterium]
MQIGHRDALIEVRAPAKVNLFLEVLRRREDGFHEIETLMVPLDLSDSLRCLLRQDGDLRVTCRWTHGLQATRAARSGSSGRVWDELPEGEGNLVFRALRLLKEASATALGMDIEILKRIPSSAGLGGASSDAAAALMAANRLWRLEWSVERLSEIAAMVGSDVPFFLRGTAAVCRGRGEQVETVGGFRGWWLVIVRPPTGLSTARVYQECRAASSPLAVSDQESASDRFGRMAGGQRSAVGLCEAAARDDLVAVARQLFNRLQLAAERQSPWIGRLASVFDSMDCLGHQMSGSGSSYFGICRHAGHARRLAGRLRSADLGAVFVTATQGIGPCRRRVA